MIRVFTPLLLLKCIVYVPTTPEDDWLKAIVPGDSTTIVALNVVTLEKHAELFQVLKGRVLTHGNQVSLARQRVLSHRAVQYKGPVFGLIPLRITRPKVFVATSALLTAITDGLSKGLSLQDMHSIVAARRQDSGYQDGEYSLYDQTSAS